MADRRRADDGSGPVLSERQRQILDFIGAYTERYGVSPTFEEIGDAVGLKSSSGVKHQIEQLQKKGYVTRRDRTPRSIVVKPGCQRNIEPGLEEASADPGSKDMVSMLFFESMAAGGLAYANPEAVDTIRLPRDMVGYGKSVRSQGDGRFHDRRGTSSMVTA